MTSASLGVITPPAMPVPTTSPGSSGSTTLAITTRSAAASTSRPARSAASARGEPSVHIRIVRGIVRSSHVRRTADHRRGPSVAQTTRAPARRVAVILGVAVRPVRARPSSRSPGRPGTTSSRRPTQRARVGFDVAAEPPLAAAAAPRAVTDTVAGDRLAQVVDDVDVEPKGARRRAPPGSGSAHDDHRPACLDHGLPGHLRHALVVEHRRRDHRRRVGEPREAEPAGRSVLQPAQRLDVVAQQVGLVALRRACARRRTSDARRAAPAPASPRPPTRDARRGRPSRAPATPMST